MRKTSPDPSPPLVKREGKADVSGFLVTSSESMVSIFDHKNNRTSTFKFDTTIIIESSNGKGV